MGARWHSLLAGLALQSVALAQGTIGFSSRVGGAVNAPVWYQGEPADGRFVGQLYVGAPGGNLAPAGSPTPFRSDAGRGYITEGGIVTVPGVLPSEWAQVKLVAWASVLGASYAEAVSKNQGGVGESLPITIRAGGGLFPPAALSGLAAFTISAIPEPSSPLLVEAGISAWWALRWISLRTLVRWRGMSQPGDPGFWPRRC
jgi:hypothetical protein